MHRFRIFLRPYQSAWVFVYPSLFEGFGIPLVEAIESGIPDLPPPGHASARPRGRLPFTPNPASAEELAHHLERVLGDEGLRAQTTSKSKEDIGRREPELIARDLQAVYKSL